MPTDTEQRSVEGIDPVEAVRKYVHKDAAYLSGRQIIKVVDHIQSVGRAQASVIADLCVRLAAAEREAERLKTAGEVAAAAMTQAGLTHDARALYAALSAAPAGSRGGE